LNWSGLLIEPVSDSFKALSNKNRNAYKLNACIAKKKPSVAKFAVFNEFSGRKDKMNPDLVNNNAGKDAKIEF